MYIKLDESMNLVVTVNEPLYRGDNLNRKITYLVPKTVGEVDMLTASLFLTYVRADGTPDIEILERLDEPYNGEYYQYTYSVTCKLTKFPGEVCTWMQIYSGTPSNPTIAKSGECMLYILESKSLDDYVCDRQMTAFYQLMKQVESGFNESNEAIENIAQTKADSIIFDESDQSIQLTAGGTPIGEKVSAEVINNAGDEVIVFTESEDSGETDDESSEDEVIYF